METTVVLFIVNGLLGIAMYFIKLAHDNTKDEIRALKNEVKDVRERAFLKEDFRDFKLELWNRLDRIEADVKMERNG